MGTLTDHENSSKQLLFPDLSYKVIGCAFRVHKKYGSGHKGALYQEAFAEELNRAGIVFKREPVVHVVDPETAKVLKSCYRPDFLIENKIIVELKALPSFSRHIIDPLYDYLHNSRYELGYLINFAENYLKPIRAIYTNDRKHRLITKTKL